jgi:hypothetical protein
MQVQWLKWAAAGGQLPVRKPAERAADQRLGERHAGFQEGNTASAKDAPN